MTDRGGNRLFFSKPVAGMTVAFIAAAALAEPKIAVGRSLEHTLSIIGARDATLLVPRPVTVSTNIVIPSNVDVEIMKRGQFLLEGGADLTIEGALSANADQHVFVIEEESSEVRAPQVVTVYPGWFGAVPDDDGNDTRAVRLAGRFINLRRGGVISFLPGAYVVGRQSLSGGFGNGAAWRSEPILLIEGTTDGVAILGNGAVLRAEPGLRLGSFDPVTGTRFDPPSLPFLDADYQSHAYFGMIQLRDNPGHVRVQDLELDGNIFELELGGFWGDVGRQSAAVGVWAYGNDSVEINRVHSHHHGTDGLLIGHTGLSEMDAPTPHRLHQVVSEYNARQGLSWVGGIGLHASDSHFNHTGRARFSTPPGAGLDIEAEEAVVRDGLFEDCEFINNTGVGMVADSGDGGYSTFRRSVFWGTTNYAIWPNKPRLRFEGCEIYGTVVRAFLATNADDGVVFSNCHFEDQPYPGVGVFAQPAGLIEMDAPYLLIEDSTVVANTTRGLFLDGTSTAETLRNVVVEHRFEGLAANSFQSLLRGTRLDGVEFRENFPNGNAATWYVQGELVDCVNLFLQGPRVRWLNPVSGPTGQICGP